MTHPQGRKCFSICNDCSALCRCCSYDLPANKKPTNQPTYKNALIINLPMIITHNGTSLRAQSSLDGSCHIISHWSGSIPIVAISTAMNYRGVRVECFNYIKITCKYLLVSCCQFSPFLNGGHAEAFLDGIFDED